MDNALVIDNALMIDVLIGLILLAGLLIGAKRGLFRSLAGLVIVVAAIIGAVSLADLAVEPATDLLAPVIENSLVTRFTSRMDQAASTGDTNDGYDDVSKLMEKYGVPDATRRRVLEKFREGVAEQFSDARAAAVNAFRSALSASLRTVLRATIHTVLTLIFFAVLVLALKLIALALDHVLDAPVLSEVNGFFGAALGLAEAVVLICILLQLAARFGVTFFTDHAKDTHLLPYFLDWGPLRTVAALFRNP